MMLTFLFKPRFISTKLKDKSTLIYVIWLKKINPTTHISVLSQIWQASRNFGFCIESRWSAVRPPAGFKDTVIVNFTLTFDRVIASHEIKHVKQSDSKAFEPFLPLLTITKSILLLDDLLSLTATAAELNKLRHKVEILTDSPLKSHSLRGPSIGTWIKRKRGSLQTVAIRWTRVQSSIAPFAYLSFLDLVFCQQSYKMTRYFPSFSTFQSAPPAWSSLPPHQQHGQVAAQQEISQSSFNHPRLSTCLPSLGFPVGPICSKLRRLTIDNSRGAWSFLFRSTRCRTFIDPCRIVWEDQRCLCCIIESSV